MSNLTYLIILVTLAAPALAQADCQAMKNSGKVQKTAEGLTRLAQSGSQLWPTYSLATTPLLLLDSKDFPACVVVIKDGEISAHSKPADFPTIKNTVYEFCDGHEFFATCPTSATLPKLEAGIIYELSNSIQAALSHTEFDFDAVNFMIMAHEGFHFIGQSVSSIKLGWWKELKRLSGASETRTAISKQCYFPSSEVADLTNQELKLLQEMIKLSFEKAAIADIRKAGREFLSVRLSRYNLLKDSIIKDRDGSFTCQQAEVAMEFSEGLAEFIGLQSSIDSKMMSAQQVQEWLSFSLKDPDSVELYYKTGAMVLLTIKNADSVAYQKLVTNLIAATSLDKTIMHEFSNWVEQ